MLERELECDDFKDPDDFNEVLFVILHLVDLIFHLFQYIPWSLQGNSSHDNMQDFHLYVNAGSVKALDQIFNQVFFKVVWVLTDQLKFIQDDFLYIEFIGFGQDIDVRVQGWFDCGRGVAYWCGSDSAL